MLKNFEIVVILDFGAQYTQLIARRIRELGVYCEIHPFHTPPANLRAMNPKGIILSGGPSSVYEDGAPHCLPEVLEMGVPVLGICYGVQLLSYFLGGKVESSDKREYGGAQVKQISESHLLAGLPSEFQVWMSHGDHVTAAPTGFEVIAKTDNALGAIEDNTRRLYGLQFHPEVAHTPLGKQILENFVRQICGCQGDWSPASFAHSAVERVREQIGDGKAICGLSGGVDSAVAAAIVARAIGDRLTCIFVDNGLLRKNEFEKVLEAFRNYGELNVKGVAAGERFLNALKDQADPERKRKIIGYEFIEVFQEEAAKLGEVDFLVQ
ncbi:MAG: glutamine-hydrolyzing GMP synthase, partial [Acidobacteriota bacterium]